MDEGGEDGGDNGDPGIGDDDEIEELDHDMEKEKKFASREKKEPNGSSALGHKSSATPSGSKKLMGWVSLFQNDEETVRMENSECA
jgi:hypothetical protein